MPQPLPIKIMNFFMRGILVTPFHFIASKRVLLISMKGRKSGKNISTPVSYSRENDKVTVFTDGKWWHNLEKGAPVTLRIRGKNYQGFATACEDDQKAKQAGLRRHLAALPGEERFYRVKKAKDGTFDAVQLESAAQRSVMIRVKLKK